MGLDQYAGVMEEKKSEHFKNFLENDFTLHYDTGN